MKKRRVFLSVLMAIVMLLSMGSVGFTKTQSVDTPPNLTKVKLNEYELLKEMSEKPKTELSELGLNVK